jgi:HEAT repeat protein
MSARAIGVLIPGLALLLICAGTSPSKGPEAAADADAALLKEAGIGTDGPSLIAFLRKHSPVPLAPEELQKLIPQLGSSQFHKRKEAADRIVSEGWSARAALAAAQNDRDAEVARQARRCLPLVDKDFNWGILCAAVRRLARERPPGVTEALLQFLPNAAEEQTTEEVWYALDSVAAGAGKLDPALLSALKDRAPARRAAAACIVACRGNAQERAGVRQLLTDPDAMVRLRVAQGLLAARDKSGLPVLVALLNDPRVEISWQAEELLHWAAQESSPKATIGAGSSEARERCREAWDHWWRQQGATLNLAKLDEGPLRPGLVLAGIEGGGKSRVALFGCDGGPRWEAETGARPFEVHLLPGNRLLIAEGLETRVTERDLAGRIVAQFKCSGFVQACCRLPNGNTVVIGEREVAEIGPGGQEVYRPGFPPPRHMHWRCLQWLNTNRILCAGINVDPMQVELLTEFDPATGRKLKEVRLENPFPASNFVQGEAVAGGAYLLSSGGPVREVDASGATRVHQGPLASALRNGNLLVPFGARMVETDRRGRVVWEAFADQNDQGRTIHDCLSLVRFGFPPRPAGLDLNTSLDHRLKKLRSKDPKDRAMAARMLAEAGPKALPLVPALVEALNDPDADVRREAMSALGEVGPDVFPSLIQAAKDRRPLVRAGAVWVLGSFPGRVKTVGPLLVKVLKHDDSIHVRRVAAKMLGNLGWGLDGFGYTQGDEDSLKNSVAYRKYMASLEGMAPEARKAAKKDLVQAALPHLIAAIQEKDQVRDPRNEVSLPDAASGALAMIGPDAKEAVPQLVRLMGSPDSIVKQCAMRALSKIAPTDQRVLHAALELVKQNQDLSTRVWAAGLLRENGPAAKAAVPDLILLLKAKRSPDPDHRADYGRSVAAEALAQIGPKAKSAIPALTEALRDEYEPVRQNAKIALEKIQR